MKIRLKIFIIGLTLVFVAVFVISVLPLTFAEDENTNATTHQAIETTLEERINAAKLKFSTRLSAAQRAMLKNKCVAAQAIIKKLGDNTNANVPARVRAYQNLESRLNILVERLKDKGIDTATLEEQINMLNQKINTFNNDLASYKQALSDLKDMNCEADTDGFKAALESAREIRKKLAEDIADIKSYVTETIKPTLMQIRDQLKTQEEGE